MRAADQYACTQQMITQTMLRNSPHLEADVFEHAELEPGLGGREARYGKTLCVPFTVHTPFETMHTSVRLELMHSG